MKKLITLFFLVLFGFTSSIFATSVTKQKAQEFADNYFKSISAKSTAQVTNSTEFKLNEKITSYIFEYGENGFVITSADDNITPLLAYSIDNSFKMIAPVELWLEAIGNEITEILNSDIILPENKQNWENPENLISLNTNTRAVNPLMTTNWDQNQWYNYLCPAQTGGPGGKAYAGCVATSIGQIMKYHNFPEKGVLSHKYVDDNLGMQSADFGATTYNWAQMGNSATSSNYLPIATILRHAGVAVNMNYDAQGSGAYSQDVPWAMSNFFNYNPFTIKLVDRDSYTSAQWIALLKNELDNNRPMYYSGVTAANEGHAWVCDGYTSTDLFHMNWGWSGFSNGNFAVTASINAGGWNFTKSFSAVIGIQPYNPDLIIRLTDTRNNQLKSKASTINWTIEKGAPTSISFLVDDNVVFEGNGSDLSYKMSDNNLSYAIHNLKVRAIEGTDTVYHFANVNISDWEQVPSGYQSPSRGIGYIHAVDTNVIWTVGYDGINTSNRINEFSVSVDGGKTFTSGFILPGNTYGIGNICGVTEDIAFVSIYNGAGNQDNTCGVYKTSDRGLTWVKKGTALQGTQSFANNVYFWDENNGMCHGDVKDGYFEIYTTNNGGDSWVRVPKANIGNNANPASGEGGWTSVIEAVGDSTIIFGSNKSKLYISHDRGYNWEISNTGITPATNGGINTIAFKDKLNGIAGQTATSIMFKTTNDGGLTWTNLQLTGSFLTAGMTFVPGTDNTYVCTGSAQGSTGAAVSYDGGNSWTLFENTQNYQFLDVDAVSPSHIWAGGFNTIDLFDGIFSFEGKLIQQAPLLPITNLVAQVVDSEITLTWDAPVGATPTGYKIFRDNNLITTVNALTYVDSNVPNGDHDYCVVAVYTEGESAQVCVTTWVTTNVEELSEAKYRVYPNPVSNKLNIVSPNIFKEIRLLNNIGNVVYKKNGNYTNTSIDVVGMSAGIYILQIIFDDNVISKKVIIK